MISLALAAALWPPSVSEHCSPLPNTIVVGVAMNSHNEFLYCEQFYQTSNLQFHADYVRNAHTFATKELNYSVSPLTPSVKQLDSRSGELREVTMTGNRLQLLYQGNKKAKVEQTDLLLADVNVIDTGFNNYIHSHWDELIAGNNLSFSFGSMSHQKLLPLRISAHHQDKCHHKNSTSPAVFCFIVVVDNAFLRMLIGNIKLNYDQQHRLQEFNGTVNIQDDNEKTQSAIIHYFYQQDYR